MQNEPDKNGRVAKTVPDKKKKEGEDNSVEQRLNTMSSTLLAIKELMEESGILQSNHHPKADADANRSKKNKEHPGKSGNGILAIPELNQSNSETTIYHCVLQKEAIPHEVMLPVEADGQGHVEVDSEVAFKVTQPIDKNSQWFSSSSEDQVDTSDELIELEMDINDRFIADCAREAAANKRKWSHPEDVNQDQLEVTQMGPKEKAEQVTRQAEASKAMMLATPGTSNQPGWGMSAMQHSSLVDEKYVHIAIGSNIEPALCEKIVHGEFVEFSKLLPRD